MGCSRVFITQKADVVMSHICSKCGFPVNAIVHFKMEVQKTYSFFEEEATETARETADQTLKEAIGKIEKCKNEKRPLPDLFPKKQESSLKGLWCYPTIQGYRSPCPLCLNTEPWQNSSPESRNELLKLNEKSFPKTFFDAEAATIWAFDVVKTFKKEIDKKRKDESEIKRCAEASQEIRAKIKELEEQKISIPEKAIKNTLDSQIGSLKSKLPLLGFFDFKEKREIKTSITAAELKLKDINETINKKEAPIEAEIRIKNRALAYSQSIAFGYQDGVQFTEKANACAYYYSPNPMPYESESKSGDFTPIDSYTALTLKRVKTSPLETNKSNHDVVRFCRKCGFELQPDSIFCSKCGTKVE